MYHKCFFYELAFWLSKINLLLQITIILILSSTNFYSKYAANILIFKNIITGSFDKSYGLTNNNPVSGFEFSLWNQRHDGRYGSYNGVSARDVTWTPIILIYLLADHKDLDNEWDLDEA